MIITFNCIFWSFCCKTIHKAVNVIKIYISPVVHSSCPLLSCKKMQFIFSSRVHHISNFAFLRLLRYSHGRIQGWLLLKFFTYLHNQLSLFNSTIVQMSEKRVHQIESKNEWLLLSVTFTAKLELVFVLTFENALS